MGKENPNTGAQVPHGVHPPIDRFFIGSGNFEDDGDDGQTQRKDPRNQAKVSANFFTQLIVPPIKETVSEKEQNGLTDNNSVPLDFRIRGTVFTKHNIQKGFNSHGTYVDPRDVGVLEIGPPGHCDGQHQVRTKKVQIVKVLPFGDTHFRTFVAVVAGVVETGTDGDVGTQEDT